MGRKQIIAHQCRKCLVNKRREDFPLDKNKRLAKPYCKPCYLQIRRDKRALKAKPKPAYVAPVSLLCKICNETKAASLVHAYKTKRGEIRAAALCKDCRRKRENARVKPRNTKRRTGKPCGQPKKTAKTCRDCGQSKSREQYLLRDGTLRKICLQCVAVRNQKRYLKCTEGRLKYLKSKPMPTSLICRHCKTEKQVDEFATQLSRSTKKRIPYSTCKDCYRRKTRNHLNSPEMKAKAATWANNRRSRKLNAFIEEVTKEEVIKRHGTICYLCKNNLSEKKVVMEHVVPLSRGGLHSYDNILPACQSCNARKRDKLLSELDWYQV